MWKYLLLVVALQIVLALVAYAMVRLGSQGDKTDLVDADEGPKDASTHRPG